MLAIIGYALFCFGIWLIALCGPPLLALWFYYKALRYFGRWLSHLLFFPCALVAEVLLLYLFLFAVGFDGEGESPGLGFALIPLIIPFLGTLGIYCAGVIFEAVQTLWDRLNR